MKKGFTLIELLVVVVILALLASVIVVNVDNARKTSRDAKRRADIIAIQNALEQYYASNNKYPDSSTCTNSYCTSKISSSQWIPGIAPNYMQVIPSDPVNKTVSVANTWAGNFLYYYRSDTTNYRLFATRMESDEGFKWAQEDGGNRNTCPPNTETGGISNACSFEVFSPNVLASW